MMFGVPERNIRDCRDSSYFLRFAKNNTSQGGEDGILSKLFELIGTTDKPYCVDIGAWDGQHLSNTYQLINGFQWGGLLVEANSERYETLCALYTGRSDVTCIDCLVDIDGDSSLNAILQKQGVPFDLEFISIDVDGADYHLWHTIGETYKPRVMCIEFNPTIPNHVHYVQERDITIQEGSSLLALTELGRSFGYHLVVTTTFNAIFVRQDLMHRIPQNIFTYLPVAGIHKLPENKLTAPSQSTGHSIERVVDLNSLHNCSMVTDIFQTYSGELKLCGPKKLMWHRVSMNIQQMQAIKPKKDRVFPFAPPYSKTIYNLENSMAQVVSLLQVITQQPSKAEELNKALLKLTGQCSSVYDLSGRSKQSTATLKDICKEIWLNAVCMSMIVCRDASSRDRATLQSVLNVLYPYLYETATGFEGIGDQYIEMCDGGKGASTTSAILEEGKQWYQRGLHIYAFLGTVSQTGGNEQYNLDLVVSRLSRKLSAAALQNISAPAWIQSLREPRPSLTSGAGTENGACLVQSSVEDIDEILNGLFWKELSTAVAVSGDVDVSGAEGEKMRLLDKKWKSKLLWAESGNQTSVLKSLVNGLEYREDSVGKVEASASTSGWIVLSFGLAFGCVIGGTVVYIAAKVGK